MESLKEKQLQHFENYNKDDIFLYDNVKKAVLEDKEFFNICKEHILEELKKHSNKTSYNVVERLLNNYSFIKKDIFGDLEK